MGSAVTETLIALLLRLSEGADPASCPDRWPVALRAGVRPAALRRGSRGAGPGGHLAGLRRLRVRAGRQADRGDRWIDDGGVPARCDRRRLCSTTRTAASFQIHCTASSSPWPSARRRLPEPLPGLWQLGRRIGGRELFVTLARSVVANPALVSVITTHARGPAALIAPRALLVLLRFGCRRPVSVLVPASEVIGLDAGGRPRLDDAKAAVLIRGGPARLEVRVAAKIVLIDGTRQHVPERPFELLRRLVEQACGGGGPINNQEFEIFTGRDASDVLRELKRALTRQPRQRRRDRSLVRRPTNRGRLRADPRSEPDRTAPVTARPSHDKPIGFPSDGTAPRRVSARSQPLARGTEHASPRSPRPLFPEADVAAARLRRRLRPAACDHDDLRQELLVDLIRRLPAYDPARGSLGAFANVVLRNQATRIAARVMRERRATGGALLSLDARAARRDDARRHALRGGRPRHLAERPAGDPAGRAPHRRRPGARRARRPRPGALRRARPLVGRRARRPRLRLARHPLPAPRRAPPRSRRLRPAGGVRRIRGARE